LDDPPGEGHNEWLTEGPEHADVQVEEVSTGENGEPLVELGELLSWGWIGHFLIIKLIL
jgi:hypothetical protein